MGQRFIHCSLVVWSLSCCLLQLVVAGLVNVTVDDTDPDPLTGNIVLYSPEGRWNVGNSCTSCLVTLDPAETLNETWHEAVFDPATSGTDEVQTASLLFNGEQCGTLFGLRIHNFDYDIGSAIYVYGILSQSLTNPDGAANLSFFIDGQLAGTFDYIPPGNSNNYTYNAMLWANNSIAPGSHTFSLQNGYSNRSSSLVMLDYIVYSR